MAPLAGAGSRVMQCYDPRAAMRPRRVDDIDQAPPPELSSQSLHAGRRAQVCAHDHLHFLALERADCLLAHRRTNEISGWICVHRFVDAGHTQTIVIVAATPAAGDGLTDKWTGEAGHESNEFSLTRR